jgi:RNA polymerase sigma-70 factor, ECF subfamily
MRDSSPPTIDAGERELVRRMLAGDESAFDEFFNRHFPRLFRFAQARLGPADLAEELAQATLTTACRKLHTWRGEAALFTWLATICRREIAHHMRQSGRDLAVLREDEPEVRAHLETLAADVDSTPDRSLEIAETSRLVQLTLDYLPGRYGDVLEWKYLCGWSVAEIASQLAVSEKAAESLLARARAAFRDAFTREPGFPRGPMR